MRVALYGRVSKDTGSQDTENQLHELRDFCHRSKWTIEHEYVDRASGKIADRPQFKKLFEDAGKRRFDLVLFWSLDRFTREGVLETLNHLQRLSAYGVGWRSYQENYLDSCGPFRDVVISLMATLAKQERFRISERTKAGLHRARRAGKVLGRPRVEVDVKKLRAMQAAGMSLRKIAARTKLSLSTVARSLRVLRLELPKTFIAAKLQYLSMANPEHLAKLKEGVEVWNAWRKHEPSIHIDLSGADLSGGRFGEEDPVFAKFVKEKLGHPYAIENLSEANLSKARLSRANLSSAKLAKANFAGANLLWADLQSADLAGAKFAKAHLAEADLSGANLTGAYLGAANLSSAHLTDANLNNVLLRDTQFSNVDLSSVRGLHSVRHEGPSSIGIDTLFLSQGNIPEVFLRGAGVPESFITYVKSLVGLAVGYYSLFISYSTKDQEFADRLYADLQAKGVRCWFAPHDVQGGRKLHEQIDEAIRLHDKLLLILSFQQHGKRVGENRDLQGTEARSPRQGASLVPDQLGTIRGNPRLGVLRCRCREGLRSRDPGVLYSRLQSLEGSRRLSERI